MVVGARLLLLLVAVALTVAGIAVALDGEPEVSAASKPYTCPMHAEVSASGPGRCPICKMALEPLEKARANPAFATAGVEHPPDCPMHAKQAPNAQAPVAAAVPPSSAFGAGVTWLPETHPPLSPVKPSDGPVMDAPKRRVFTDDVRAPAWLEAPGRVAAVLYRDELVELSPGELGKFRGSRAPQKVVAVRLTDDAPAPWDASTSLVRFSLEPSDAAAVGEGPREGDVGWLELAGKPRELLVFPESALLRSSDGPYVLVPAASKGEFERRSVQIGRILRGHVVVLSGLDENDRLVVGNAFFLDAEVARKPRPEPLAGVEP